MSRVTTGITKLSA